MTVPTLEAIDDCFEGVIPSIIATVAADGTSNVVYLSHVIRVDPTHVALSNQFFGKTGANLRANPRAALLVVDGRTGAQYRLAVIYLRSETAGALFERVALQLAASSVQVGMAEVMRLRAVDVFRVEEITAVPSRAPTVTAPARVGLDAVAHVVARLGEAADADAVLEVLLDGLLGELGAMAAIVLLHDPSRGVLTAVASRGYPRSGIGAEAPLGEGMIGSAGQTGRTLKINDMSRVRRLGAAAAGGDLPEERTRTIALPGIEGAVSQIAVPMVAAGGLVGVVFAESRIALAFGQAEELALSILARQAATALRLAEVLAGETVPDPSASTPAASQGRRFRVVHHSFDDSVFIDEAYVIKGVAGRLLVHLLRLHRDTGRRDFSNRELRLATDLRLPELKDNLETRLLLLRRRLEEKASPVRLLRTGRGTFRLVCDGISEIETAEA
jgi:adenylate cyclase